MKKIEESMEKLLSLIDVSEDNVKKSELMSLLGELTDINERIHATERADEQLRLEAEFKHEENSLAEKRMIVDGEIAKANIETKAAEKIEDRDFEREKSRDELVKERAEIIGKIVVAGCGILSACAGAFISVKGWMNIFAGVHEWDKTDKIPCSNGWDLFRKNAKF